MKKFIIIFILSICVSYVFIIIIGKKTTPGIYKYLDSEARRIAISIVNNSASEILSRDVDYSELIINKENENKEIELFDYNTKKVNELLVLVNNSIQEKLFDLEEGKISDHYLLLAPSYKNLEVLNINKGIICFIPLGTVIGVPLLANFGPYIPVRISFVGDVISNLRTTVKSYGINNVYLQIDIVVEIREQIMMPMLTKSNKLEIVAPLLVRVIQGKIPNYYLNDMVKDSNYILNSLE